MIFALWTKHYLLVGVKEQVCIASSSRVVTSAAHYSVLEALVAVVFSYSRQTVDVFAAHSLFVEPLGQVIQVPVVFSYSLLIAAHYSSFLEALVAAVSSYFPLNVDAFAVHSLF